MIDDQRQVMIIQIRFVCGRVFVDFKVRKEQSIVELRNETERLADVSVFNHFRKKNCRCMTSRRRKLT